MLITKKPELLSPAGSMDSVKAAVNNGCDAVYIGGRQFSARQYADNFGIEELAQVCDYCHLRGVKVYITVNTIYKDCLLYTSAFSVNSYYVFVSVCIGCNICYLIFVK